MIGPVVEGRWIDPVVLEGDLVRLDPLRPADAEPLWEASHHPELWAWMPFRMESLADMRAFVERAVAWADGGRGLGFVIRKRTTGEVVGHSAYLNAAPGQARVEIGATWVVPAWQRTRVNTEVKLLLMTHAFDALGAVRVEFKTDAENEQSRAALRRIGALEEGTLRHHMRRKDGGRRDSVYFAVIREEWPDVRAHLDGLLARPA